MRITIFIFCVLLCSIGQACGSHPGITHEEWTSSIRDERDSRDSRVIKSMSDGFFSGSSQPAPMPQPEETSQPAQTQPAEEFNP